MKQVGVRVDAAEDYRRGEERPVGLVGEFGGVDSWVSVRLVLWGDSGGLQFPRPRCPRRTLIGLVASLVGLSHRSRCYLVIQIGPKIFSSRDLAVLK